MYLHNLQIFGISKVYVTGLRFQVELTRISVTKRWSDLEVNAQIDKDLNPQATRPNFHRDITYT